ncbi:phage/plasmid primase, P4 family [Paracoccus versutus]|uniref:Putative DNA primase/helicase n=1 Tax=Paracoccus versutus TaxID=34007 RepID=A0A3D9XA92_PARVE|nr:phage/plasmid primase, P4 family [Paracoccus versutus]REF67384.1 putative DNA primase/helicase [Paracoccus versutus]WGR58655.1 hypothetical protein E3U25_22390 [Paracoccus versutus]
MRARKKKSALDEVRSVMAAAVEIDLPASSEFEPDDGGGGFDGVALSHDALALEIGRRGWDENARYVALWGRWLFWDGVCWRRDESREDMTRVRDFLRQKADEVLGWADRKAESLGPKDGEKLKTWAKARAETLRHKSTVASVEFLAQSNSPSASLAAQFDADLMLLGTPGGTVDLRTGELRQARREDMITKLTAVAPAEKGAEPERWLTFLHEIFDNDHVIIDFMQRAAGYALTGMTNEHKLLFLYGTGRNGKSVFLNTLFWLWNDYARKAAAETFLNSQVERHSTDIAGLHGARLVMGSELPRGKTWDESVIKDLTGGDKLSARFMRQDFFDFDPQLTLMIAGNTQPSFRGVDEAIRSRVVMVPFTVTIPPDRRDTGLPDKLKAEGPAILRWCIEGVDMWLRRGLDVPDRIAAASAEYFDSEDTVGQFIADEIDLVVGGFESSADLHQRFTQWIERQGMSAWTQNTLIKELRGRGFTDAKGTGGKRGLKGLKIKC